MSQPLSDDFPVLLGPVRVETRFTATELLVRVFPDEWAIAKDEPLPSSAEIGALDAYWTARWAAAGAPAGLRAAWQELVTRVPAGRASWLLTTRTPSNPGDEPAGLAAGTTVLVVVTPAAVAANDRTPTVNYWTAVWRAHGERLKLRQADAALVTATSTSRAATIRSRRPSGVENAAVATGDAVAVAFLVLPPPAAAGVAPRSWTQGAQARLLPDRFQVLGYVGDQQVVSVTGAPVPATLAVSPDPAASDQLSVDPATGALHVPDALRWLTDFDRAVQAGMGLRIPLTDPIRDGLDRLVVFGLRPGRTPQQSAADLTDLITRQLRSPGGYALMPQGTPTNNSEQRPAGPDTADEADAALRAREVPHRLAAAGPASWTVRTDGQQFAELLGLDPAVLAGMPNADGTDQRDARAANTALWPATWGSYLRTALHPILPPDTVEATRDFFLRYVSGRGPLPAVKIGRQPYGLLATTAFSRLAWPDSPTAIHRRGLHHLLSAAAQDWAAATAKVPRLPRPGTGTGDPHQLLLDILALHPTSAEYHQRYARSVEDLFNRENLGGHGHSVQPALDQLGLAAPVRALLARFGHDGTDPDLLRKLFVDFQQLIQAPLVDDRPLSETDPVRAYATDGRNYLRRLADAAGTSLDTVRLEADFAGGSPPPTLLYLLLRHAVLLGWADTARALAVAAGVATPDELAADPAFVHIRIPSPGQVLPSESRFRRLYSPEPAITGDPSRLVVDHVPAVLRTSPSAAGLAEQVDALGLLADLPTAKLERVLSEHLDLATYRLDAWRLGLATERLAELRYGPAGTQAPTRGVHLGAYGWLEDVRPRTDPLTPVTLTGPLAQVFAGSTPLLHDPRNAGFIHAPSPAHARTAAVLRAGYVANATPANPGTFAVNLSSERVRTALGLLDGLRQGQSLGALLGHQFERGLHDRYQQAEVDSFIDALRQAFPLRAGRIGETVTGESRAADIGLVEARNVVDGLALVRHVTRNDVPDTYKFGIDTLPDATEEQAAAISAEVRRLIDLNDALADLAVAEGTHQALSGNTERATATLDAYAKEGFPPDPAVVRTPRSGVTLTHRFGLRLTPGLAPNHGAPAGGNPPRAQAEPAVNDWLPTVLPDADEVAALVTWTDPVSGQARSRVVTQDDLGLAPIDLLWTVRSAGQAAMTDLEDRIVGAVVARDHPRPDAVLTIQFTSRISGKVSFFELSPLVGALRTLFTTARPLRVSDQVPAAGATPVDRSSDDNISLRRERPSTVRSSLAGLATSVAGLSHDLSVLFPAPPAPPNRNAVIAGIDTFLTRYAGVVTTASSFGMTRSGWGELNAWRRQAFGDVLTEVAAVAAKMTRALADADAILSRYDALPQATADAERFRLLRQADRLLLTTLPALPAKPATYRTTVGQHRTAFNTRLQPLAGVAKSNRTTLSALLADVAARGPLTDIDPAGLDLTAILDRVVAFGAELLARSGRLAAEIADRLARADAALAAYDAAVTAPDRVQAGVDALKALLGPDVLVVPEYAPPSPLAADWRKARGDSGKLLQHLTQSPIGRDFPVDDWLHGVARVREMPRLWEKVIMLSDALRDDGGLLGPLPPGGEPQLTPIQLPFHTGDHWLGMEFAANSTITEDKLLFTAHYANETLIGPDAVHCGLLFDEWTEVVPAGVETTGIAMDVNRPDSEPPQAMLLVSPPVRTGAWKPDDLLAAITETFAMARQRAVEPAHLEGSAYAQLLPAALFSATTQPITISTDLAIANARWKATHD
jgi:hypothetical protein